jgi:hypothetical protein
LNRYPNTDITIAKVSKTFPDAPSITRNIEKEDRHIPTFIFPFPPDIVSLGFNLSEDEIKDPSKVYYFEFQQHPGELRFGLDEGFNLSGMPNTVNELSWGHFVGNSTTEGENHTKYLDEVLNGKAFKLKLIIKRSLWVLQLLPMNGLC